MAASKLTLHNTLTNRDEVFRPVEPGRVAFYSCGPTVYDFAHIGNFRSFLAADLLRRWLESALCERMSPEGEAEEGHGFAEGGYVVLHVMNITDVGHMTDDDAADGGGEDKMEAARKRLLEDKKSGKLPEAVAATMDPGDPYAIANYYAGAFIEDAHRLGLKVVGDAERQPERLPRATRMIRPMLEMIERLLKGGHAYIAADGVCYFDTQSFPAYGRLSGNTLERIRSGAGGRVAETTQSVKKHPADFMLWKPDPKHLMRWNPAEVLGRDIGLGEGYPGWHIECSAMAYEVLGRPVIDLHSGGEDNIFPHHECEIAQSCCALHTERFANYWFHPRFLMVEGEKMSKSKGNFFTVRDLLGKGFSPAAIRFELIKTHYRANANFTEQGLRDAQRMIERWHDFASRGEAAGADPEPMVFGRAKRLQLVARLEGTARKFADAMNNDLSVGGAIGVVNSWINATPTPNAADAALMRAFGAVLGVLELDRTAPAGGSGGGAGAGGGGLDDAAIEALLGERAAAKKAKDFARADAIRDELAAAGIVIKDGATGATWSREARL
ncbi:MAG: cysteine--tRNA ligase [Phycisphaerales bacterium]